MTQHTFFLNDWLDYMMNVVMDVLIHDHTLINYGALLCGMMLHSSLAIRSAMDVTYNGVMMLAHLAFE